MEIGNVHYHYHVSCQWVKVCEDILLLDLGRGGYIGGISMIFKTSDEGNMTKYVFTVHRKVTFIIRYLLVLSEMFLFRINYFPLDLCCVYVLYFKCLIVARSSDRALNKQLNIQRRLAWSLCKDDTHNRREIATFFSILHHTKNRSLDWC